MATSDRYPSRHTCSPQMLDKEFTQVVARLAHVRPSNTTFFAYAATVNVRSSSSRRTKCHGWVGIRLQAAPRGRAER